MIDQKIIERANLVIRALNHEVRQDLMKFIGGSKSPNGVTVTEIHKHFSIEQSIASQHVNILWRAGLLAKERKGRFIYYKLNPGTVDKILSIAKVLSDIVNI